jgi:hypothetical protein
MTVSVWTSFVRQALLRRLSVTEFAEALELYDGEADGRRLFAALVESRIGFCAPNDPLVAIYMSYLATSGLCSISQALLSLAQRWNRLKELPADDILLAHRQAVHDITVIFLASGFKTDTEAVRVALMIAVRWLLSLIEAVKRTPLNMTALGQSGIVEAVAQTVASIAASEAGLHALSTSQPLSDRKSSQKLSKELRAAVKDAFEQCLLFIAGMLSPELVGRIDTVLKHVSLLDSSVGEPKGAEITVSDMQVLQFQASIAENQVVSSRAGTLLYLESLLFRGGTIDDSTTITWLCTRHHSDYETTFCDLIVSSFTIMHAQTTTHSRPLCSQQCQIYIQNKLPTLLSKMSSSSFDAFVTDQAIVDAWSQVGQLLSTPELLTIGAQFLHVCSLLHLLPSELALQLIGNQEPSKNLSKGLFTKDALVEQISKNHSRGPKAVEELVRGDGSTGFISQALVEVMMFMF